MAITSIQPRLAQKPGPFGLFGLGFGLGAGCPQNSDGTCDYNGMPVSCSLIRECDSITGATHFEYALPSGTSPNVNIAVANPTTGQIIGYQNEQAKFVDTPDISITQYQQNMQQQAQQQALAKQQADLAAKVAAAQQAAIAAAGPNPINQAIAAAKAAALTAASATATNMSSATPTQTQWTPYTTAPAVASANSKTNVANTPQNVSNQQGSNPTPTNQNASKQPTQPQTLNQQASGGSGSILGTPMQGFSTLLDSGSSWLEGESFGIKNSYLAIGAVVLIAVGGGYIGGTRRGR